EIAFIGRFSSSTTKSGSDQAVFVRKADGSWKVIRRGEKASNQAEPISSFGTLPGFNDNGDLTFIAEFEPVAAKPAPVATPVDPLGPSGDQHQAPLMNKSLFIRTADGLKSLVKLGDEVPLMPSHFSGFANASTNSKGVTAFIGTYSDPDGRGLFLIEDGKMRLIVRSGQKTGITGQPDDAYSEHFYPSKINERNEVAFMERIGDRSGIFVSRTSGVELVAITGKPSPIKDANYLGFGNRTPSISNKGEVAFVGFFDGPNAGRGLFFKPASGPVQLLVRDGDKAGDW